MLIPESMMIKKTKYWIINHRINSALPGYIMMSSQYHGKALYELPNAALQEMGILISKIDKALRNILHPNISISENTGTRQNLQTIFILFRSLNG